MSHKLVTSEQIVDANDKSLMFHFFVYEITNATVLSAAPLHSLFSHMTNATQVNYKQIYMTKDTNVGRQACIFYKWFGASKSILDMYLSVACAPNAVNLVAINTPSELKNYKTVETATDEWVMVDDNTKKRVMKKEKVFTGVYDARSRAEKLVSRMYYTPSRDIEQEHNPKYIVVVMPVRIN